jgi:hypothetical protein
MNKNQFFALSKSSHEKEEIIKKLKEDRQLLVSDFQTIELQVKNFQKNLDNVAFTFKDKIQQLIEKIKTVEKKVLQQGELLQFPKQIQEIAPGHCRIENWQDCLLEAS